MKRLSVFLLTVLIAIITCSSLALLKTHPNVIQKIDHNKLYTCQGETIQVGRCRHESDEPGYPPTKPEDDWCMVYYPNRPLPGGFTVQTTELLGDLVKRLQACGAFSSPENRPSEPASAQPSTQPKRTSPSAPASADPSAALTYLVEAEKYSAAKDYPKATEAYKKSIAISPSADAYSGLGDCYQVLEKNNEATTAYLAAIRLRPNEARPHWALGINYVALGAIEKSIASFQEAVRLSPKDSAFRADLAHAYFVQGQFPEAVQAYQQALGIDPKNNEIKYNLGIALIAAQQRAQALRLYQSLTKSDAEWANLLKTVLDSDAKGGPARALADLGEIHIIGHEDIDAHAAFNNALRFKPTDPDLLMDIANGLSLLEYFDEARNVYRAIIAAKPKPETMASAYYEIGNDYVRSKQYQTGIGFLQEAIRLNPKSFYAHFSMGLAYFNLNQQQKAVVEFNEAEALTSNSPYNSISIASEYVKLKQFQRAEGAYQKAIRLDAQSAAAYFGLGSVYCSTNRKPDALRVYTTLKTLDASLAQKLKDQINQMR